MKVTLLDNKLAKSLKVDISRFKLYEVDNGKDKVRVLCKIEYYTNPTKDHISLVKQDADRYFSDLEKANENECKD